MKSMLRKALRVTSVTGVAAVFGMGLISNASAAENTLIKNDAWGTCLTAMEDGGTVFMMWCDSSKQNQLWDRRGNNIVRAYTNQCLDSSSAGRVYWLECNGGRNQMWDFRSDKSVVNVATVRWLNARQSCGSCSQVVETTSSPQGAASTHWTFG